MPIYEYICEKCENLTEALQKFSDPPLTQCPHCTGKLKKLISLNSFHLKGTGWYVTDFADPKPEAKKNLETKEKPETKEIKEAPVARNTENKNKEEVSTSVK